MLMDNRKEASCVTARYRRGDDADAIIIIIVGDAARSVFWREEECLPRLMAAFAVGCGAGVT
jgi:hypothetical protein